MARVCVSDVFSRVFDDFSLGVAFGVFSFEVRVLVDARVPDERVEDSALVDWDERVGRSAFFPWEVVFFFASVLVFSEFFRFFFVSSCIPA